MNRQREIMKKLNGRYSSEYAKKEMNKTYAIPKLTTLVVCIECYRENGKTYRRIKTCRSIKKCPDCAQKNIERREKKLYMLKPTTYICIDCGKETQKPGIRKKLRCVMCEAIHEKKMSVIYRENRKKRNAISEKKD